MDNDMPEVKEVKEESSATNMEIRKESFVQGNMREVLLLSGAVLLGSLIIAGSILTLAPQSGTAVVPMNNGNGDQAAAPVEEMDVNVVTSIDNDPVLGDKKKAKVAIVEFTDYECPFCKKFHTDSFDTLVKDYVDTGKAVIVTRDFPLSFHDPKATDAAAVAECVRKEKGDAGYFAFSKAYYENTATNGKGLPAGKQEELIAKVGANAKTVAACALTDAVKQEIAKDVDDGGKIGVTGTPSFVIGTLAPDGTVTGERIVGALQTAGFKQKIDMFLSK